MDRLRVIMGRFIAHSVVVTGRALRMSVLLALVSGFILLWHAGSSGCELRALYIGSYGGGLTSWITTEALMVENVLDFNGIPYDFFDIRAEQLTQATLDCYSGIIIDGYSARYYATEAERQLLAANMEAGNVAALVGLIGGSYPELNPTIYAAIDVYVDGLENNEANVHLLEGAINVYDYPDEQGFIFTGGTGGQHVGMAVMSLGYWTCTSGIPGGGRACGLDLALETWMENAFGVDARVTLPVVSVRLDDTQAGGGARHQEVIDFIVANRHMIRAAGFLVTTASAYQGTDSIRQSDEQLLSEFGSMSLHGYDHGSVGAEGEDRDYERQYNDMNEAVGFLLEHFPRCKLMKACPNNSWNVATLHAMYDNGVYYHSAAYGKSDDYKALYDSVFAGDTDMERRRLWARARAAQMKYYLLRHCDETGTAEIYSVDWGPVVSGITPVADILPALKERALDLWTPLCIGAHYSGAGPGTAKTYPTGWIQMMEELMEIVDKDSYCWRRWVDTYDLAKYTQRFDLNLTVNSIDLSGDMITYNLTAGMPIRFMTLKAYRTDHKIASVMIDGEAYSYFGDDYVHLPEIDGNTVICVTLTSFDTADPHVTHIDPSAVIEDAGYAAGKLNLEMSGDFIVTAHVEKSSKVFRDGINGVNSDGSVDLLLDMSSMSQTEQVEMQLSPMAGTIEVVIDVWDTSGAYNRRWTEITDQPDIQVDHMVGDLEPDCDYQVRIDGSLADTPRSDSEGRIFFSMSSAETLRTFEVLSAASAGVDLSEAGRDAPGRFGFVPGSATMPVRAGTTLSYETCRPAHVTLTIHSVEGRHVVTLVDAMLPAGTHSVEWDCCDKCGCNLSSGVCFCCLRAAGRQDVEKIVILH